MKLARSLLLSVMEDIVARRARDGGAWLEATARSARDAGAFSTAFFQASRGVGRSALGLGPEEVERLREVGVRWSLGRWALDDLARAVLLVRAGEVLDPVTLGAVVDEAYRRGELRERQAVLRALPLLADPERFLALAAETARSGSAPLFEAVACENPYPATHFPSSNFHQLVMRALVGGVALDRIVGLGARVTPELVRMANEWAAERRVAGRSVSPDLAYITAATRVAA